MLRLQKEREQLGWSVSETARRAEMHNTTVGQIESGYIGRPYPSQLAKLAAALGWTGEPAALLDEITDELQP